jgi:hypothetical protein
MGTIGREGSQAVTSLGRVHSPTSSIPMYRFSGHSFAGRELRVSLISDAAILSEIVPGLIARNAAQFANERIEFRKVDIVIDPLPEGDLCIIRQVFQHPLERRYLHRPRESETVSSVGRHG